MSDVIARYSKVMPSNKSILVMYSRQKNGENIGAIAERLLQVAMEPQCLAHWLSQVVGRKVDFPRLPSEDVDAYYRRRCNLVELTCGYILHEQYALVQGMECKPLTYDLFSGVRFDGEDSTAFLKRYEASIIPKSWPDKIKVEFEPLVSDEKLAQLTGQNIDQGISVTGPNHIWNANLEEKKSL